jgi:hypothetical protein
MATIKELRIITKRLLNTQLGEKFTRPTDECDGNQLRRYKSTSLVSWKRQCWGRTYCLLVTFFATMNSHPFLIEYHLLGGGTSVSVGHRRWANESDLDSRLAGMASLKDWALSENPYHKHWAI